MKNRIINASTYNEIDQVNTSSFTQNNSMSVNSMSENYVNNLQGANIANMASVLKDNARQQANQYNYAPKKQQNLAETAAEIQQLLNQISSTYPTITSVEQMEIATKAVEEIEKNPSLKQRTIGALKACGIETLKELIKHPAVNILLAAIEGWQTAE